MNTIETITALCTVPGGAISIIRISGKDACLIGNRVWKGSRKLSDKYQRMLLYGRCFFPGDDSGDPALAVFMKAPNTYTGEDVVEIHCHGGVLVSGKLLDLIIEKGARIASPGEFTFRAFMNGKMDLTQAEAVGDIITAHSSMALSLAEKQMNGILGSAIRDIRNRLLDVLSEIESRLDFCEEDLDWKNPSSLCADITVSMSEMKQLFKSGDEGAVLRDGVRMVIAGRPNVGKSTLLNHILGYDRAIVTELPGTTRDTLEELANIRGIPVKLIDTAGIREAEDLIEGIGIERSFASLTHAQIIVWMMDASGNIEEEYNIMLEHTGGRKNVIPVWNKIDLLNDTAVLPGINNKENSSQHNIIQLSVTAAEGIDKFMDTVEYCVWHTGHHDSSEIAVSARHASLLEEAINQLEDADKNIVNEEWELAAVRIRGSLTALGTITGEDADPDVLDNIFSRFCIGK